MTLPNLLQGDQEPIIVEDVKRITQLDITPKSVKARHLETGLFGVKVGLEAELPENGSTYSFFWAADVKKMYAWDGENWLSSTFA